MSHYSRHRHYHRSCYGYYPYWDRNPNFGYFSQYMQPPYYGWYSPFSW